MQTIYGKHIDSLIVELAQLKGWQPKYDLETSILNWLDKDGKTVSADWIQDAAATLQLMLEHTHGYSEIAQDTLGNHSVVVASKTPFVAHTVVPLREHRFDKARALAVAVLKQAVAQLQHDMSPD